MIVSYYSNFDQGVNRPSTTLCGNSLLTYSLHGYFVNKRETQRWKENFVIFQVNIRYSFGVLECAADLEK